MNGNLLTKIVTDSLDSGNSILFFLTEDDERVTKYFERCMLKELQDKVAILQKAIDILRTDRTA